MGRRIFVFFRRTIRGVNTIPDITWDRSPSLTLNATHALKDGLSLSANAYFRYVRTDSTNGDLNDDSFDQSLYNLSKTDIAALTAAGYTGFPTTGTAATEPFPFWRCLAQSLEGANGEPSEKCNGVVTAKHGQAEQLWDFRPDELEVRAQPACSGRWVGPGDVELCAVFRSWDI